MYNFDEVIERQNTNSVKYGVGQMINPLLPEEHLPMWVADMDFACPQPILDAMKARLDKRILGYTMIQDSQYYETIISWMRRRHGWEIRKESIVFSPGVVKALQVAVARLTQPDEGVILNTPAYHPFDDAIKMHQRRPIYSPLINTNGHYTVDYADLERKAKDPKNTLFFLCNPHNPTGRVWTEEELRRIADICFANDVFIVSDEIHADLLRVGQTHIPLAKLYPDETRLITCTAPSKTFNLAGNQLANIIIADPMLAREWMFGLGLGMPNPLSVDACMAAYNECEDWLEELKVYLDGNFALLKAGLKEKLPKAVVTDTQGTYLAWIDLRAYGLSDEHLKELVSEAGLFIEFGGEFVADDAGFVRINIACPRSLVEKAIQLLAEALKEDNVNRMKEEAAAKIKIGDTMPDFRFDTPFKQNVSLQETVGDKKTMLLFLRYYGCTICQLDLLLLKEEHERIAATGGQLLVVLQSDPAKLAEKLQGDGALPYEIICDPEQKIYQQLRIRPAKNMMGLAGMGTLKKIAQAKLRGLEHGEYEGEELQLPAAFVIEPGMKVSYARYGKSADDIPEIDEIIKLIG